VQNVRNYPKKMDKVQLLMFNKVYHTFLSNPVKINKKTPRLFRDNGALEDMVKAWFASGFTVWIARAGMLLSKNG